MIASDARCATLVQDGAPSTEASELAKPEFMTDDFRMFRFKVRAR